MAISAPVEIASYASTGNVTTSTVAVTAPVAADSIIFITAHGGGASSTMSASDTQGNTWTATAQSGTSVAPANHTQVFWAQVTNPLTTADSITVTRAATGGLAWIASSVIGASGIAESENIYTGGTRDVLTGSVTVSDQSLVIAAITCRDSIIITPGAGYAASNIMRSSGAGNPRGGGYIYAVASANTSPAAQMDIDLGWTAIVLEFTAAISVDPPLTGVRLIEYDGTTSKPLTLIEWNGTVSNPLSFEIEPAGLGTIAVIGDSNTYRDGAPPFGSREATTRSRLVAAGWAASDIYWYGAGGKAMIAADQYGKTTLQNLDEAKAQLGNIDRAVIALGTNDTPKTTAQFTTDMNVILDKCVTLGIGEVVWVNLAYKASNNTNSTTFNPIINTVIGARSFAQVADWHTYIHTTTYSAGDWITEDGTHYTAQGYAKRDAFIIEQVNVGVIPPEEDLPLMGGYLGAPGETPDERYFTAFGAYPDLASTYFQASGRPGGTINLPYEKLRSSRGTIPTITITSVGGPYTMSDIAAGTADDWITYWGNQIAAIGGEVWFTFDHEFEVKLNQNKWSPAPTIPQYAAAFNRFISGVKALAPLAKSMYWYGYSDTGKIGQVGSSITPPDIIALDPYVFSHHGSGTTFEQMVEPKLTWLRAQSWYQGQPIILAEYAKDTVFGDALVASFLTNLRPRMKALGIAGAMYFCRDKPGDIMANISAAAWPLSRAAYRASQLGGAV